ncbi:MAG: autotransporter outer membrane beta-barrel domain-containing protein, partial [Kiritimatiellaceae bacterium]|nr:autotransporter outer membrane beta-barrel domain-containing protein [Kiritimatiellaceae bacterium]
NILIGIAGGKGNGSIDKDTGSSTDTDSVHAALYGSMGTKDWFVDASFIYGISDVDSRMGVSTFDTTSDYSAQNIAFYVGGGKEMQTDYLIFTPQLSMLANSYAQDGYTEEASNAVEREIDSFDAFYLQSSLGCSMGMYIGSEEFTFKPEIRAHWLHEWIGDDENINYNLVGGTGSYNLALQAPEKDILKIGVGAAAKFGEYLELRVDLDTRQSGSYSDYTLLGSLRYQF